MNKQLSPNKQIGKFLERVKFLSASVENYGKNAKHTCIGFWGDGNCTALLDGSWGKICSVPKFVELQLQCLKPAPKVCWLKTQQPSQSFEKKKINNYLPVLRLRKRRDFTGFRSVSCTSDISVASSSFMSSSKHRPIKESTPSRVTIKRVSIV